MAGEASAQPGGRLLYGDAAGNLMPIPDPTKLTTEAVNRATGQFRVELANLRELIEARLDAMDKATDLRLTAVDEVRPQTAREIQHLEDLVAERFTGIDLRFTERDTRTTQAERASQEALKAALQAAKELVDQQNKANAAAAEKAEANFTKQIDQILLVISTMQKGFDDRWAEIKERIDRGEGGAAGAAGSRTERRLDIGQAVAVLAIVLTVVGLLAAILSR